MPAGTPRRRHTRVVTGLVVLALAAALLAAGTLVGPRQLVEAVILGLSGDTEFAPDYTERAFGGLALGASEAESWRRSVRR